MQQVIGVISDTHGHLPEKAISVLQGEFEERKIVKSLVVGSGEEADSSHEPVDVIIHAGDIGELEPLSQGVLDTLERVAPVYAVLGNRDPEGYTTKRGLVSSQLLVLRVCGVPIAVMHQPDDLLAALRLADSNPLVRIHGHTHIPKLERCGEGLMLCPGSLHRPKGDWPMRTAARLVVEEPGRLVRADIIKI